MAKSKKTKPKKSSKKKRTKKDTKETLKLKKKSSSKKTRKKKTTAKKKTGSKRSVKIDKIRAEPIIDVKHEDLRNSSSTVEKVGRVLGLDTELVRILFIISFVFLIGIPVYVFLSLFMKD